MGKTANYQWPYPELVDKPDGASQIKALAQSADATVKTINTSMDTIGARFVTATSTTRPTPTAGKMLFETDTGRLLYGITVSTVNYWVPLPGAHVLTVRQTTAQNVPEGATGAALTFQVADFDPYVSWVVGSPSRFTPKFPGWFHMTGGIGWASNQTNYRAAKWAKKGVDLSAGYTNTSSATNAGVTLVARPMPVYCDGLTDYVELWGVASMSPTGGTLGTSPGAVQQAHMTAVYLGP